MSDCFPFRIHQVTLCSLASDKEADIGIAVDGNWDTASKCFQKGTVLIAAINTFTKEIILAANFDVENVENLCTLQSALPKNLGVCFVCMDHVVGEDAIRKALNGRGGRQLQLLIEFFEVTHSFHIRPCRQTHTCTVHIYLSTHTHTHTGSCIFSQFFFVVITYMHLHKHTHSPCSESKACTLLTR